jgi:sugar/nucleoside kinase (ribokinase family)
VDYVHVVPVLPQAGATSAKQRLISHFVSCGGQVATTIAACAALGLRARYLGPQGTDDHARRIRDELARREVDVAHLITRNGANQFAVILVESGTGERIVLWDRDAALSVEAGDIDPETIATARVLHVDDVDEQGSIAAARIARAHDVVVTSDLDRLTARTPELVASVTVPIFAEHVPPALTGEADLERALRKLRAGHHRFLCVTLGERGAVALDGDRFVHVPAVPVTAIDSTAAGDIFRAGVIYALLLGKRVEEMLAWGNAAAAVSCTRAGAMSSVPTLEEIGRTLT